VEPDPSLQTVRRGAAAMQTAQPDWIIGLGGGSSMDAAKAMWILYENPDIDPAAISPFEDLGLRAKARLLCIPTTAGTGSEANYAVVLTDKEAQRKLTLGSREATPDIAIVDPAFTAALPAPITADTGIDVLSHAVEAYTCTWANDFTDGLCLQAARLVARHLPAAVAAARSGEADEEAREKMANAAALAGMTLGNSQVALAHAMGHAAGAIFKEVPHGRITAIFLPVTIEFVAAAGLQHDRYADLAAALSLPPGADLPAGIRTLMQQLDLPTTLAAAGIDRDAFAAHMPTLVEHVEMDAGTLMCPRFPETTEIEYLFWAAYNGESGAL
jgi:alcohol dehydrogenase class IV